MLNTSGQLSCEPLSSFLVSTVYLDKSSGTKTVHCYIRLLSYGFWWSNSGQQSLSCWTISLASSLLFYTKTKLYTIYLVQLLLAILSNIWISSIDLMSCCIPETSIPWLSSPVVEDFLVNNYCLVISHICIPWVVLFHRCLEERYLTERRASVGGSY